MPAPHPLLGHSPDNLPLPLLLAHTGTWIALPLYTPANLALRLIAAAAPSRQECLAQILSAGLNPADFEFHPLPDPLVHRG